jgi:hypothetical protein
MPPPSLLSDLVAETQRNSCLPCLRWFDLLHLSKIYTEVPADRGRAGGHFGTLSMSVWPYAAEIDPKSHLSLLRWLTLLRLWKIHAMIVGSRGTSGGHIGTLGVSLGPRAIEIGLKSWLSLLRRQIVTLKFVTDRLRDGQSTRELCCAHHSIAHAPSMHYLSHRFPTIPPHQILLFVVWSY